MPSNPIAGPTRASTLWNTSVRVPNSPTNRPSNPQPTGVPSPKHEQAPSTSPLPRTPRPSTGQAYARPASAIFSVPDPLPRLGSPYQGAPARNRRRMPGDLADEGAEESEEEDSAEEGSWDNENDEEDDAGQHGEQPFEYALNNAVLMSLSKPSPVRKLPQGSDKFELAMARRYSMLLSPTGREDGSPGEQPTCMTARRHPSTVRTPSTNALLVNTQAAQGPQAAPASTPVAMAHTTGRSATAKRLLPTVPPSPILTALKPTAPGVSSGPTSPTSTPGTVRTPRSMTPASPVVGLDSSMGSSTSSLIDGAMDTCTLGVTSSGGLNLTSSSAAALNSSTNSLDEIKAHGGAFKTTTVLDPDKTQGEQVEAVGGGKALPGLPPTSPLASTTVTSPTHPSTSTSSGGSATSTAPSVAATTSVDKVKKSTSHGHLLSQTGRSASSRAKSPTPVASNEGESRNATRRSSSTTNLFAAARSPRAMALTSRGALRSMTQRSILEDSEENENEGAAGEEGEGTGPEAVAERQKLWLCIVSTIFSQQMLVFILHKKGRQLESQCFLGMTILRSQWLHQLQVDRQHSMQQKTVTCLKAIKLFRRYKGRLARRRFMSRMVLLRSFFNGPVYNYVIAPQTRAVKILTTFLQEILDDKFLRRKLMRRLLYNIHKCQRFTRQYLDCTAARLTALRNYWARVEATYHAKVRKLIELAAQVESDAIRMQLPSPLASGDINTILPLIMSAMAAMSPKSTPASPSSASALKPRASISSASPLQALGGATVTSPRQASRRGAIAPNSPTSPSAKPSIDTDVAITFTSGQPASTPTATRRPSLSPSAVASPQRMNSQRNSTVGHPPGNSGPQTPISGPPASDPSVTKQDPPPRLSVSTGYCSSKRTLLPPQSVSVAPVSSPQPIASGGVSSPQCSYSSMGTRIRVPPDIVAQLMPLGADYSVRDKQFALHMVRVHQQTALDKLAAFTVEPGIRDGVLLAYLSRRRLLYRGTLSKIVQERVANRGQLTRVDTQLTLQDAYDFIQGHISDRVGQALSSPLTRKSKRVVVPVFRLYSGTSDQDMLTLLKEGIAIQHARTAKHNAPLWSEHSAPQHGLENLT